MKEEEEILADAVTLENQSPAAVAADAAFRSDRKRLFDFIRRRVSRCVLPVGCKLQCYGTDRKNDVVAFDRGAE